MMLIFSLFAEPFLSPHAQIPLKEKEKTPPVIKQEAPLEDPLDPKNDVTIETPEVPIEFVCVDDTKPKVKVSLKV